MIGATVSGQGEPIEAAATGEGLATNSSGEDPLSTLSASSLLFRTLAQLQCEAESTRAGRAEPAAVKDDLFGVVAWLDGMIIDSARGGDS